MLWTDKLEETIEYYKTILGFTVNEYNEDWGWANLSRDGVEVMFARPNEHEDFKGGPKFTGSFYITVENADEIWAELKSKTQICYSINNFEYGMRDFGIYDNNGYLIQFGHVIEK
jgi:uncharacterized glyoxalase superfamily protein PhnB